MAEMNNGRSLSENGNMAISSPSSLAFDSLKEIKQAENFSGVGVGGEIDSDDDEQVEDINEEDFLIKECVSVVQSNEDPMKGGSDSVKVKINEENAGCSDAKDNGSEKSQGPSSSSSSQEESPMFSLSRDSLKAKLHQGSLEFEFMKPICAEVLREPSDGNLKMFEDALLTLGKVPAHLCEFVIFPFAIHLKVIKNYKESQRIKIFSALSKLLGNCELSSSYDMFVNIFQKLFVSLANPGNMTILNSQLCEDETKAILKCVESISVNSLPFHLDAICQPDKVQIFGHSIFILLQLVAPDVPKDARLKTLRTLVHMVKLCDGKENRSKTLYQFLPGIISKTRKICITSAGQTIKSIAQASLSLMGSAIKVSTEFIEPKGLEQADGMLSQIVEILSKDYVLNTDAEYRKSFYEFCKDISTRHTQLPQCSKTISSILLRMKEDSYSEIARGCVEVLETLGIAQELNFDDLTNLMTSAETHLKSGDDTAGVLALREASSILSTRKLSFLEFQVFLPLLFQLMNNVVWKFRNSLTVDKTKRSDPIFISATKLCQNVVNSLDADEVIYEFTSIISELQNNLSTVSNPIGILVTFNIVLTVLLKDKPDKLNEYEAANLAEIYLGLIDMQSTELALNNLSNDIPAVQSVAEIRKAYLLEGLGILGKSYPNTVHPIVIYPLIEHAGLQNSEAVNEAADLALKKISYPLELDKFLQENLSFIMSEVGLRMCNLMLYPNCPSALVYLAKYYDFSEDRFSSFIENTFARCSDTFGGGGVQHIYVKVFYALVSSISNHFNKESESAKKQLKIGKKEEPSLLERLLKYQRSVGITHPSVIEEVDNVPEAEFGSDGCPSGKLEEGNVKIEEEADEMEDKLDPVRELVLKISHRVLNFLPNNDRTVKLSAMECLIISLPMLKHHENSLLPLSHTIWQNLVPRFDEKDYVIVRKSFELLQTLCICSGTFLRKRTIDEAFPRLSTLLLNLAKEGEQVKNKNRQYYTYTQAYKLQLTVLQGMGYLVDAIDVQEFELDKIVNGCIMFLRPDQHKNLREAATNLLEMIGNGQRCRTVWMKLFTCGLRQPPESLPHPSFTPLPKALLNSDKAYTE